MIGAIVLLVVFVGIGAYVASIVTSQDIGGSNKPSGPAKAPSRAKPVQSAAIEKPLESIGFSCYTTLQKTTVLRSCYRTEADGLRYAVRIHADTSKQVAEVRVESLRPSYFRHEGKDGKAVEPLKQILPVVSKALLGPDAEKVPSLEAGPQRSADIAWGAIHLEAEGGSGLAKLTRKGAPAWPEPSTLSKDKNAIYTSLQSAGYDCDQYGCDKDLASAESSEEETAIEVVDSGSKVAAGKLRGPFSELLNVALGSAERTAAEQWAGKHLDPKNGTADADIGGVHLRVDRKPDGGRLTITPLLTRS